MQHLNQASEFKTKLMAFLEETYGTPEKLTQSILPPRSAPSYMVSVFHSGENKNTLAENGWPVIFSYYEGGPTKMTVRGNSHLGFFVGDLEDFGDWSDKADYVQAVKRTMTVPSSVGLLTETNLE